MDSNILYIFGLIKDLKDSNPNKYNVYKKGNT